MDAIRELLEFDFVTWILGAFIVMSGVTAAVNIIGKFSEIVGRPFKWWSARNKDHDSLAQTISALAALQALHEKDAAENRERDEELQKQVTALMKEVREYTATTKQDLNRFAENRMHDRQQSLEIQKGLTGSIDSLMTGVRELLGHEIDQCYERYVNLGGVPESEAAEFDSICEAYRELRGNHGREIKYGYVKKNLPILPVSTKLREE